MADARNGKDGERYEDVGPGLGSLHVAWHAKTGRPALRFFPSDRVEWRPSDRFEVLLVCEPSPPSITLMVGPDPVGLSPAELGDVLVQASASYSRVEHNAEAHAHLTSGKGTFKVRSRRFGTAWRVGLGAVALVLLMGLGLWCQQGGPEVSAWVPPFLLTSGAESPSSYPLPDRPFRNQETPPCRRKLVAQVINGGCWIEIAQRPPCGKGVAEYQGRCYLPSAKYVPMPQAAEP